MILQSEARKAHHTSRNSQKSQNNFKCSDPRHVPKVMVFHANFRKVKINIVLCPVFE